MKIDLSGPFQSTGKESLPELALAVKANGEANGEKIDFEGGLTVLGDRAYIGYNGKKYEVDPTTFGFIKSGFEEAEQEGEKESAGGEATACQKAADLDRPRRIRRQPRKRRRRRSRRRRRRPS